MELLKVKGIPHGLKSELKNIAKNSGLTVSGLVKAKLREVVNSYPEHMRMPKRLD